MKPSTLLAFCFLGTRPAPVAQVPADIRAEIFKWLNMSSFLETVTAMNEPVQTVRHALCDMLLSGITGNDVDTLARWIVDNSSALIFKALATCPEVGIGNVEGIGNMTGIEYTEGIGNTTEAGIGTEMAAAEESVQSLIFLKALWLACAVGR
ncbi:MAG: hypothetical protein SGCHY_005621, partial [Lobulomycetales sp.]